MQPCSRLVQNVQSAAGTPACKLCRQFHPLAFATGESDCRLAQPDITQPYIYHRFQFLGDGRNAAEEFVCFAYGHFQNIIDILAFVFYSQSIFLVPASPAFLADNIDRRQEIHFYYLDSGSLAFFTASSRNIERESSGLEPTDLRIRSRFEKGAYVIENTGESRRVTARGPSDRGLVYFYQLVYIFHSHDLPVRKRMHFGIVEFVFQHRHQGVVDER